MDDRTPQRREDAIRNPDAPTAPSTNDKSQNGRQDGEREYSDRSSKPALTERERRERWPVG